MWKIPLFDIDFDAREHEAVHDVLDSGWLTMGEITENFERRFADLVGVRHAIAVANCTAALHLANRAVGVKPGDEVICPALTFVASANSIACLGARPVFADVESLDNLNLSPNDVEARITPRTRAIQVVHYAGYPAPADQLARIARHHGLALIEDCAHAPGALSNGRHCGAIGDVGCFSFFSNKNMTTGEGGMLTTDDDSLAEEIRLLRTHGMTSLTLDRHRGHAFSYDVKAAGYNYRLDEIRSAIGLVQMDKLSDNNKQRARVTARYHSMLKPLKDVTIPFTESADTPSYHIMPVLVAPHVDRSALMLALKDRGIQTSIHYPPIHLFSYYRDRLGSISGQLPNTEEVGRRELTLPLYPAMTNDDVDFVCNSLHRVLNDQSS